MNAIKQLCVFYNDSFKPMEEYYLTISQSGRLNPVGKKIFSEKMFAEKRSLNSYFQTSDHFLHGVVFPKAHSTEAPGKTVCFNDLIIMLIFHNRISSNLFWVPSNIHLLSPW